MSLKGVLALELDRLGRAGETVSYGALARRLEVPGPGSIAALTAELEALMRQDAAGGRPFRAAVCAARLGGGLPAPGFFALAAELGRYAGQPGGPEAERFVADERAALRRV